MTSEGAINLRQWRARLGALQTVLLPLIEKIRDSGLKLHTEATELALGEILPDLERIGVAIGDLAGKIDQLNDEKLIKTFFRATDIAESQRKLRHDLRTPINAIKGYGEMLLEDLEDLGGEPLRPELLKLQHETNRLLSRLYAIVEQAPAGPATAPPKPEPRKPKTPADKASMGDRKAGREGAPAGHILIVDDIKQNRDVLARRLKREGHTMAMAKDGSVALRKAQEESFDLVLLDVMMPVMDGFETLARLKADEDLRGIPVIMISAVDEMDAIVKCIEFGAEDFLAKPFNVVLLKARIDACLEKKFWRDSQRQYLDRMVEAMDRVEHGDLDVHLPVSGADVYAELYSGFNLMTDGLRDEAHILDIAKSLSGELNLDILLNQIIRATTRLLDADRSTLFLYDGKTDELWSRVAEGLEVKEIRFPAGHGIAGAVLASGNPENVSDPYNHPAFNQEIDLRTGYKTESILCMPIVNKAGEPIGVTQVLNKRDGVFTGRDEERLSAFTAQIAVTLENAQLFDDVLNMKNYNDGILKSTSNGLITLDTDYNIVTANDASLNILRRARETLTDHPATEVFADANAWVMESVVKVEKSGEADISVDADLHLADGARASVNLTVSPLIDVNDKPIGSMVIIEDITNEKRVKTTMARYMSKEVADELLAGGEAELGGKSQKVSILFSDIRNFTSLSEVLGARDMVTLLNAYFEDMVDVIFEFGGILDKYIGDAIMALFGVPFSRPGDADNAVAVANEMLVALAAFNRRRTADGFKPLEIGVGISTGDVIAGSIGSPKRMEYTVIGDSVNLAARLESANKFYGTKILMSEATVRDTTNTTHVREIDLMRVKGKDRPVAVFEALDFHDQESFPNMERTLDAYNRGLAQYRGRDWASAISSLEGALDAFAGDVPSKIFLERALHHRDNPPPEDWDGVWTLTQK
ncbi:MAG: adenylate/guanylate cyclase domain-containing protein [Rhodospirillales bacterium]|jgi:PAS domain S-box-containing protein|nr:adenylate/guanylate cyclase domain-containing protein [Rhodospirillales bacterium]MDP6773072.1 adenylate/guanylate cyclase domain-containing protein [Rhodospirillales bacterium]